jgi:hypothetical protein
MGSDTLNLTAMYGKWCQFTEFSDFLVKEKFDYMYSTKRLFSTTELANLTTDRDCLRHSVRDCLQWWSYSCRVPRRTPLYTFQTWKPVCGTARCFVNTWICFQQTEFAIWNRIKLTLSVLLIINGVSFK